MTRQLVLRVVLALASTMLHPSAFSEGHYIGGVEGTQAASVPPPGVYFMSYLVHYNMTRFQEPGSHERLPTQNTGTINAMANGLVWITPSQLLGADYGMQVIAPLTRASLKLEGAGVRDQHTGLGDIYVSPLLRAWHGERWDAVTALGAWLDNGKSDSPVMPGKGYKTTMLTGGATYYFDKAKTISGSVLARYEINSRNKTGIRPGDQLTMEWGLAKNLGSVQVGLVGYSQWQTTNNQGTGTFGQRGHRHALGGELIYPIPSAGLVLKGAFYQEVDVKAGDTAQARGQLLRFTVMKQF